ncbi:hypothetical protein JXD38_12745 [candidate division WOR-3 bacterium]|nr:hypothetical protein [candidate division WOR-3 bacterium]
MRLTILLLVVAGAFVLANDNEVVAQRPSTDMQSASCDLKSPDAIAIPHILSYQGRLTDTLGQPVPDGSYTLWFRLYTEPSGGGPFWTESQGVNVRGGIFRAMLGATSPILFLPDSGGLYLGLQVESDPELSPRHRIVSAAYAYVTERAANAGRLQGKDTTGFVRTGQAGSVTSSMIVDGTVAAADLGSMGADSGQVMKWDGSAWVPSNDSAGGGGGGGDSAWVRGTPDSVLFTVNWLGMAKGNAGNMLYGDSVFTHVNLGAVCTTGTDGQDFAYATVAGGELNAASTSFDAVLGGYANTANGGYCMVGGGANDTAAGFTSGVPSGYANVAGDSGDDTCAVVAGGRRNRATARYAAIGGGRENTASGIYATVAGGYLGSATGQYAAVGGGYSCAAAGDYATVAGGYLDTAIASYATVGGGYSNVASAEYATIAGGDGNSATGDAATICGGDGNAADTTYATVGGGYNNAATGYAATVGGGTSSSATGDAATVGGGFNNNVTGFAATTGGGSSNAADTSFATVGGGYNNNAGGYAATVGGGDDNDASGDYATVPGGAQDSASGDYSFATNHNSVVPGSYSNSAAFNGQTASASNQTRVGVLSKASGTFTIDHPLDPHGKMLNHYFIEGPEMRNIYDGEAVLDATGRAVVTLPDYFDALNRKPRVQLTGVGTQEVAYVAEDVSGNRFTIGGPAGTKVYWQVTGERKDVSAEATRRMMPVEQPKTGSLAGRMLDDEFLSGCMEQLVREGKSSGIDFRTAAGRAKYDRMKQHPRETGKE